MLGQSVYLTTLFLSRLRSLRSYPVLLHIDLPEIDKMSFLNQRYEENDRRKYFMINLYDRMLPDPAEIKPATSWSPVGCTSHWATKVSPLSGGWFIQKRVCCSILLDLPNTKAIHQWVLQVRVRQQNLLLMFVPAQLADYKLLIFFLIFPQKTDFGISCKLSLQEQFAWNVKTCFL